LFRCQGFLQNVNETFFRKRRIQRDCAGQRLPETTTLFSVIVAGLFVAVFGPDGKIATEPAAQQFERQRRSRLSDRPFGRRFTNCRVCHDRSLGTEFPAGRLKTVLGGDGA